MGWNPSKKPMPQKNRKKKRKLIIPLFSILVDPNSILLKHKNFLRGLEEKKVKEREDKFKDEQDKEVKTKTFKDNAAAQRQKIRNMKQDDNVQQLDAGSKVDEPPKSIGRLTEQNL